MACFAHQPTAAHAATATKGYTMSTTLRINFTTSYGDKLKVGIAVNVDADSVDCADAAVMGKAQVNKGIRTGDTDMMDAGAAVHAEYRNDARSLAREVLKGQRDTMARNDITRAERARLAMAHGKLANKYMRGA